MTPLTQLLFGESFMVAAIAATTLETAQLPLWSQTFIEYSCVSFATPYVVAPITPATAVPWPDRSLMVSADTQFDTDVARVPNSTWAVLMPESITYEQVF